MKTLTLLLLLSVSLSVGQDRTQIQQKQSALRQVLIQKRTLDSLEYRAMYFEYKYDSLRYQYQSALKIAREKAKEVSSLKILSSQQVETIIRQTEDIKRLQLTIDSLTIGKKVERK